MFVLIEHIVDAYLHLAIYLLGIYVKEHVQITLQPQFIRLSFILTSCLELN